jgi:ketosteroid isomerase-like protein
MHSTMIYKTGIHNTGLLIFSLIPLVLAASCGGGAKDQVAGQIIAMERAALDRWGHGDPQGYIETFAPEITYFDPAVEKRVDGVEAMKAYIAPFTGKIKIDHYDMINPTVQRHGDAAVLSYNLVSYARRPNGATVPVRWNCTEVYSLIDGKWKIIHNHWSYTKPELKQPSPE